MDENLEGVLVWSCIGDCELFESRLKAHFFQNKLFGSLWGRMAELKSKGVKWDLATIYADSDENQRSWMGACNSEWAPKALIPVYTTKIIDRHRVGIAQRIIDELRANGDVVDPEEVQKRLREKLIEIEPQENIKTAPQIAKELFAYLEKAQESGGITGITCGFRDLNTFFNGFQPARLYVLAARPSMGKSSLMMNFALQGAKSGASIYIHCLEESLLSFSSRMLSNLADVDNEQIQRGSFSNAMWGPLTSAAGQLSKLNLFINDKANVTAASICQSVRALAAKQKIDMVFLDHIQDLQRTKESWHHDISEACGLFKALAKDLNIPVMIVSQLNRGVESRQDKRPALSDLKESGDIEAKADVVFLLYRDAYYNPNTIAKDEIEIRIAKNRDGRVGVFKLRWNASKMRFAENIF